MKSKIFLIIAAVVLVITNSCKDNSTGPGKEKKSPRDYTWTADTIFYEGSIQTLMRSIWGSSANDLYVCGHSDDNRGQIWHFDGEKWSNVDIFKTIQSTAFTPYKIHGISSDNIFIACSKTKNNPIPPPDLLHPSFLIQYNGSNWIEHDVKTSSAVYDVYAETPTNVWACGADGIVYHYDGSKWSKDTIKIALENNSFFQLKSIVSLNSTKYMLGIKVIRNGERLIDYFFENKTGSWIKIDSFITDSQNLVPKWGGLDLYKSSSGKLFSYGIGGIFEWTGITWISVHNVQGSIDGMYDIGNNNILAAGSSGKIYYYDGIDWQLIENVKNENILYTGVWMDEDEAFIIGYTLNDYPMKTVVLHGK